MIKKEGYGRKICFNSIIVYHGRIKKEEEAQRTYQETQNRERKLAETNPRIKNRIRKNTKGWKEEGKVQNKFLKLTQEN